MNQEEDQRNKCRTMEAGKVYKRGKKMTMEVEERGRENGTFERESFASFNSERVLKFGERFYSEREGRGFCR